jgi:hypothetical protein
MLLDKNSVMTFLLELRIVGSIVYGGSALSEEAGDQLFPDIVVLKRNIYSKLLILSQRALITDGATVKSW